MKSSEAEYFYRPEISRHSEISEILEISGLLERSYYSEMFGGPEILSIKIICFIIIFQRKTLMADIIVVMSQAENRLFWPFQCFYKQFSLL